MLREAGGSTKMARLISEVGKQADIMASADFKVIDNNLIPDFAEWNIRFATNQLVLCYTDNSRYAKEITSNNWYEILLKKDSTTDSTSRQLLKYLEKNREPLPPKPENRAPTASP